MLSAPFGPGLPSSRLSGSLAVAGERAAGPHRHRDRPGRGRRSHRRRRRPGAGGGRRDAEPRRPAASPRRAERGGDRAEHAPAHSAVSFEYEDLGAVEAEGLCRAQCRPGGVSARARSRAASRRCMPRRLTPLVGREEEIELLLRRWQRAKSGEGQVVLLSGEPGIGKSRLTAALAGAARGRAAHPPALFLLAAPPGQRAAPDHRAARTRRGLRRGMTRPRSSSRSSRHCSLRPTPSNEDVALLAELLSIPAAPRPLPGRTISRPSARRNRRSRRCCGSSTMLARQRPVLMVFEDVHWVDPDLAGAARPCRSSGCSVCPCCCSITFRPEFSPPWTGQAHVTTLTLNRLDRDESAALVAADRRQ